jgi:hypothetical protein
MTNIGNKITHVHNCDVKIQKITQLNLNSNSVFENSEYFNV